MQRPDWRGAAAAMGSPSGPRILVVARNSQEPIAYYRGARNFAGSRRQAERVDEIDVLSTTSQVSPPGHGFRLTEKRGLAPCCILWRYVAPRRTLVRTADVAGDRILQEPSKALLERVG